MDQNMLDSIQPVTLLLDELKSIVGQLEGYGIDTLVLSTGADDVIGSASARQFTHQSNFMLNNFKHFCAGQRAVKHDGTSTSSNQELSFSIDKLISDTQTAHSGIDTTQQEYDLQDTIGNTHTSMNGGLDQIVGNKTCAPQHIEETGALEQMANDDSSGTKYNSMNGDLEHIVDNNTCGTKHICDDRGLEEMINGHGCHNLEVKGGTSIIMNQENVRDIVNMDTYAEELVEKNHLENVIESEASGHVISEDWSSEAKTEKSVMKEESEPEIVNENNESITLKVVKISGDITGPYVVIDNEKWNFLSLPQEEKKKLKHGYKCGYCERILKSLPMYREHCTKMHHAKIGYRCGCKIFFTTEQMFNKHIETCPYGQFICEICHDVFRSQQELDYHDSGKHSEQDVDVAERMNYGDFPCAKCGIVFGHYNLLVQHNETFPYCEVEVKTPNSSLDDLNSKYIDYIDDDGKEIRTKYGEIVKMQTKPPYTCMICKYKNTKKSAFVRHLLIHIDHKTHECPVCGAKLKGKEGMAKHMNKHLAKPYKCGICALPIESQGALQEHMRKNCKQDLNCELCDHVAASLSGLKTHLMRHSGNRPFKCEECDKSFVAKSGLDRHNASIHSSEKPFKCDFCEKRFNLKETLVKHRRIHETPKYTCEYCGKKCTEAGNMKKHMMTHTQEKPFICEVCGKKYGRKAMLDTHRRLHTGERPYPCNLVGCNKSFRSHANLQQHIRNHSAIRPYVCDVCGKAFKQSGRLNHHRKGHEVEYRWACSYCQIKFKSLLSYKNHLARTHPERREEVESSTNIKLYNCDMCPRMFGDKEDLTRHIYIHNNVKPFTCSFCNKGFNDKSNMRQHEKTHTGDKKHVCDICEKAFIHRRDLRSHKASNHSDNANQTKKRLRMKANKAPQVVVVEKLETSYEASYPPPQEMVPVSVLDTYIPEPKPVIVQKEPDLHTLPLVGSLGQTGPADTLIQSMTLAQVDTGMDPYVLIGTLQVYDHTQQQPAIEQSMQQTTYTVQPLVNAIPTKLD